MTMRGFGNVVPIQIAMLQLAGYVPDYRDKRIRAAAGEAERRRTMREGLEELREATRQDFGYDLAAWRDYLMRDTDHGYTHPYAFKNVDPAILESIADRRRQETAEQLTREDEGDGEDDNPSAAAVAAGLSPTQLHMLELAGFIVGRAGGVQPAKNEEQRKRAMRRGLEGLRQCTGHDWGYDLLVWHQVLLACDKAYAQLSARDGFERLILQAIADEQRQRMAEELTQEREVKLRPMTVQGFGHVVPIQIAMLKLAGYVPDYRDERIRAATSEMERECTLCEGLGELCELTGQDFGYDLAAWREYLLEHEESGYTHADAFEMVDVSIVEAIADHRRQETAEWLKDQAEEGDGSWGTSGPELFPSQLFMLELAGLTFTREGTFQPVKDQQRRKRTMRHGRRELREMAGQDFGYDLAAWHEYLLGRDEGYAHPYARPGFEEFILEAIADPDRQRLAAELTQEDSRN